MAAIVWDRKAKVVVGGVHKDTTEANNYIKRIQSRDGNKINDRVLDAVTVNIQPG